MFNSGYGYGNGMNYMPPANRFMPQQQVPQNMMMNQSMNQQAPASTGLRGRIVTSIDEIRAAQIELDGAETFFPCPANASIYTKSIDMNGNAVIRRYELSEDNGMTEKKQEIVDVETFNGLQKRVKQLEDILISLTAPTTKKEDENKK